MEEKRLDIYEFYDIPVLDLDKDELPDTIVFHFTSPFPITTENVSGLVYRTDPKLATFSYELPHGYRNCYLHPGEFNMELVEPIIRKKLEIIREWLTKGENKLYFCTLGDPESAYNICSYLGELLGDCRNPDTSEYNDITKIPYPRRVITYAEEQPYVWTWDCYWPTYLDNELSLKNIPISKKMRGFPYYEKNDFPVAPLGKSRGDHVVAFSVSVGDQGGEVIITPSVLLEKLISPTDEDKDYPIDYKNKCREIAITFGDEALTPEQYELLYGDDDEDVILYIEDIPECLTSRRKGECIKTKLIYKYCNFSFEKVKLYGFIRFLYLYYCAHGENSFRYRLGGDDGKELMKFDFGEGNPAKKFDFLLKTEQKTKSKNFETILNKIISRCIQPSKLPEKYGDIIHKVVYHRKRLPNRYIDFTLTNLKIVFSHKAQEKMENLKIISNSEILDDLKENKKDFLKMIMSVTFCGYLNEFTIKRN